MPRNKYTYIERHPHASMHPYYDRQSRLLKSQLTYFCTVRARKKRTGNASEEIHIEKSKCKNKYLVECRSENTLEVTRIGLGLIWSGKI